MLADLQQSNHPDLPNTGQDFHAPTEVSWRKCACADSGEFTVEQALLGLQPQVARWVDVLRSNSCAPVNLAKRAMIDASYAVAH